LKMDSDRQKLQWLMDLIPGHRPCRVVHCKREPYDVYIGRPGPWGNPFRIGRDGDRATVLWRYER
jgi:hypothetical protein